MSKRTPEEMRQGRDEAAAFIKTNMKELSNKDGKVVVEMTQDPYKEFMRGRGVTKATLEQVSNANIDLVSGAIEVAADIFPKGGIEVEVRLRTTEGRIDNTVGGRKEKMVRTDFNDPSSAKAVIKYGSISVTKRMKSLIAPDLIREVSAKIEKLCK